MSRNIRFAGPLLLAAAAMGAAGADPPSQEDVELCERYAAEDEVSPQEWEDYLEECLADLNDDLLPEDAADSDAAMSVSDADAPSQGGNVARCGRYAVEDEVSRQDWADYMAECLADLAEDVVPEDTADSDEAMGASGEDTPSQEAEVAPAYGPDSDAPALRINASD